MSDNVVTVGIRTVMDISDVKANIGVLQTQFNKLKLPSGITDKFNQEISKFSNSYEKFQQKMAQGIKTKGDASQASKYLNEIAREYDNIIKTYSKASGMDLKSMFKIDSGPLKDAAAEVEKLTKQLADVDINKTNFKNLGQQLSTVLKNSKFSGENGLINQLLGDYDEGRIEKVKQDLQEITKEFEKRKYSEITKTDEKGNQVTIQKPGTYSQANTENILSLLNQMTAAAGQAEIKIQGIQRPLNIATQNFNDLLNKGVNTFRNIGEAAQKETGAVHGCVEENKNLVSSMASAQQQSQMLTNRIAMYFSLYEIIRKIGDVARRAFQTVKELDASMTQTAVVTNFSVSDMWEKLPQYTAAANQLGSTIKDVYDATTLYYQQGLNSAQAMGVATETLKMARIGGIEAAQATDMMTAALRGFNMQINELSAQRINDVYSKLAAITASNTEELGSAMTRTASIAHSAGMEFETTSAFLSQMIETTREAPENLGTAMKTIIARFQEMKKSPEEFIDEEGNVTSINRVDTALRSVGVSLTDAQGQFRKLDDVFLDLASRWDSLSQGQQRYVATMAAGSRQQSRFIAMMSNYERTVELVNAANTSAGASQEQFNKTLESMDTKLNKLKNAWDQFAMGLTNSTILKGAIDGLTSGITIINKFIDAIGKISPKPFENINKSLVTLVGTLGVLRFGGTLFHKNRGIFEGLLGAGAGFFQGESSAKIGEAFKAGLAKQQEIALEEGTQAGFSFTKGFTSAVGSGQKMLDNALFKTVNQASLQRVLPTVQLSKATANDFAASFMGPFKDAFTNQLNESFQSALKNSGQLASGKQGKINAVWTQQMNLLRHGQTDWAGVTAAMAKYNVQLGDTEIKMMSLNNALSNTGTRMTQFGHLIGQIPGLQTFSHVITLAGSALTLFGNQLAVSGMAAKAAAVDVLVEAGANETAASAAVVHTAANAGLAVSFHALSAAVKAFLASIPIIGWLALAIGAVITAVTVLGPALDFQKKKLENLKQESDTAAEAFSSLKQETSELEDNLKQLEEYDSAFEGLVIGTAAFNEKLLESNLLIDELLDKYPELIKFITTDENGRKILSSEGKEWLKNEQFSKEVVAQAYKNYTEALYENERLESNAGKSKAAKKVSSSGLLSGYDSSSMSLEELINNYKKAGASEESLKWLEKYKDEQNQLVDTVENNIDKVFESIGNDLANSNPDIKASDKQLVGKYASGLLEKYINKVSTKDVSSTEMKEVYAASRNLTYDSKLNKFLDAEEKPVDVGKIDFKEAYKFITGLNNAKGAMPEMAEGIKQLDKAYRGIVKDAESNDLISRIINNDTSIESSALQQFIANDGKIAKELIKNVDNETLKDLQLNRKTAGKTLVDWANNIIKSKQKEANDLGVMFARGMGLGSIDKKGNILNLDKQQIANEIAQFTEHQRFFMAQAGQKITESLGSETAGAFVKGIGEVYKQKNEKLNQEVEGIFGSVDWSKNSSILAQFTKAANSSNSTISNLGNSLLESGESSELFRDAITDVITAADEAKVQLSEFADANGEFDAEGIYEAADKVGELGDLLSSGAISASGFALAINSVGGIDNLASLNGSVIQLLNSLGKVEDVAHRAHKAIENFDEGIDTGESEDWIKEQAQNALDFISNKDENGKAKLPEWGNEQLHNIIKQFVGEDKWISSLQKHNGNLAATVESFKPVLKNLKDGFLPAWGDLADGLDVYGNKIKDIPKEYKDIQADFDNGKFKLEIGEAGTDEVLKYLQDVYGVGKDTADQMLATLLNYSEDLTAELRANDFMKTVRNESWITESNKKNGKVGMSASNLEAIAAAHPEYNKKQLRTFLEKEASDKGLQFVVVNNKDKKGNLLYDGEKLDKRLNKAFSDGWVEVAKSGKIDLAASMNNAKNVGLDEGQVQEALYSAFQKAQAAGKQFEYEGQAIDAKKISNSEDLLAAIKEAQSNEQWVKAGEAMANPIAEAIYDVLTGKEPTETFNDNGDRSEQTSRSFDYKEKAEKKDAEETEKHAKTTSKSIDVVEKQSKAIDKFGKTNAERDKKTSETAKDTTAAFEKLNKSIEKAEKGNRYNNNNSESNTTSGKSAGNTNAILRGEKENKYGKGQKDNSNGDSDITITYHADVTEIDAAKKAIEETKTLAAGGASLEIKTPGAKKLNTAYTNIKNLQLAAAAGGVSTSVNVTSKDDGGAGVKNISTIAKNTHPVVQVGASTHNASEVVTRFISDINKKVAVIDIRPDFGPATQWTKAVEVKVHMRGGKVTKDDNSKALDENQLIKGKNGYTGGLFKNQKVLYRAGGGSTLYAFIPQGTDTVPAMLTPGEYVQRKKAVDYFGDQFMRNINHLNLKGALNSLNKSQLLGSVAKGSRNRGTLGPNNRGGLTLTGEQGYEVAWIPSENRSMILGVNGPEMVDLPGDTVVWNHQESQNIIKKQNIPGGTAAIGAGSAAYLDTNDNWTALSELFFRRSTYVNKNINAKESSGGASKKDKSKANKENKNLSKHWKLKKEIGSTNVLIYNTEKKIEQIQQNIEKLQNKINKQLEKTSTTMADITKDASEEIKQLQLSYALNKKLSNLYNNNLKKADKSKKKSANVDVSWSDTYVRKKGGKKETKTKRKKASINLSKYIKQDPDTGAYQLDQKALNKVYKKNKNKGKAIREAAEKKINENTSKRDSAAKAAQDAKDKLEELGKQLYETFYGWENELTKIVNLTQKISESESKTARLKEAQSLNEAMLGSGLQSLTKEFIDETIGLFTRQTSQMANTIKQRTEAIKEQREIISKAINTTDEEQLIKDLEKRGSVMENAAEKEEAYNAAQKKTKAAQTKLQKDTKTAEKYDKLTNKGKIKVSTAQKKEQKKIKKADSKLDNLKDDLKKAKEAKKKAKTAKDKKKAQNKIDKINKQIDAQNKKKKTAKSNLSVLKNGKDAKKAISGDKQALNKAKEAEKNALNNLNIAKEGFAALNISSSSAADILANTQYLQETQNKLKEIKTAQKYIKATQNADGTIDLDIDSEQLEADKASGKISKEMYEAIKSYYDSAKEANDELIDLYNDQLSSLEEMYSLVRDLKEQYADYADELMDAIEKAEQDNIDKLSKLNDTLTNKLKSLLDEVKRRLDQRRQQEDNAKTEADIAKKQQRLATLRADTSGGHASEIIQLEKELAEAQQSYGRTLEDQTLQRLEEQADEAAKQRERQIEIAQAQLELDKALGNNVEEVNALLIGIRNGDQQSIDRAKEILRNEAGYYEQNTARREVIDLKINDTILGLATLPEEIETAEEQTETIKNDVSIIKEAIVNMASAAGVDVNNSNIQEEGAGNENEKPETPSIDNTATKDNLNEQIKKKQDALNKKQDRYAKEYANYQTSINKRANYKKGTKEWTTWQNKAIAHKKNYQEAKADADRLQKEIDNLKSQLNQYASGGMNYTTGPAWLDGTRAKPEAVLSATDTKNFIALKDILSEVMGHIDNTNSTTYGDSTYEININVDHLNNDYDVDKVAKRVEKIITQDASYRNVTMVRKFR